MKKNDSESYDIDVIRLLKLLWHRLWLIIICSVFAGASLFSYAKFFVAPQYESSIMVYVNNSVKISAGLVAAKLTSSDLSAAQGLVDTYIVILGTRSTLNEVIKKSGLDYSYKELKGMIFAEAVNSTEIFRVTVTSDSPKTSKIMANTIADVLPEAISKIVNGSSARIVDRAVSNNNRVAPSFTMYTAIGLFIGFLIGCAIIILHDVFDDTIRSEDYLIETYDAPVLAIIPDLSAESAASHKYGYGYAYENSRKGN